MQILLVRLRLIGDVVFTTPVIRAIKRRFPSARLVYVVEPAAAPIVAGNPHLDEVIVLPQVRGLQRLREDWRAAQRLRRAHFDLAIDLHGGPRSAFLTWASRARVRVGYDVPGRSWMYTHVAHRPRTLRGGHSVENQWDLLAAVPGAIAGDQPDAAFGGAPEPDRDRVEMPVDAAAAGAIDRRLRAWQVPGGAPLVVVHVSAGNPFRRWPETSFAELTAGLAAGGDDRRVVVTSGPSDRDAARRVMDAARSAAPAAANRILDGEGLSLTELRALLDRAAVFVGGDSGPLHIAATSDVAVVGLYGPTLPSRSAPWRPRHLATISIDAGDLPCRPCDQRVCAPGDFRCLTTIPAARVRDAAEQLLAGAR